ncbi:MAG: hypothetical protein IPG25_00830 [Proteobacteria bacterium]|nr:hypothetical protein [Pseudomonadota bacterium]
MSQARKTDTTAAVVPRIVAAETVAPPRVDLGTEAMAWLDKLTHTLPHGRLQALALYDARGDVLASSAAHLAIDCRSGLTDALDAFVLSTKLQSRVVACEGGAGAALLAIRDPELALRGIVLLASEDFDASEDDAAARFLTPRFANCWIRLAQRWRPRRLRQSQRNRRLLASRDVKSRSMRSTHRFATRKWSCMCSS